MSKGDLKNVKRGSVRLLREHTHRGIAHPPGAVIENLREDQVKRLEANGTAERTSGKPAPAEGSRVDG
ncbi:MAG: DUF7210 family protein [Hyphomicrobiales bacterium]